MPFKAGKSLTHINRRIDKVIDDIDGKMTGKALHIAATIGVGYASTMTPIDTSTLINSQFIGAAKPTVTGMKVECGYTANYALYVHNAPGTLKGRPRSSVKSFKTKSGSVAFSSDKGNFWDPDAEPRFLLKGFEQHMEEINAAFFKAMRI